MLGGEAAPKDSGPLDRVWAGADELLRVAAPKDLWPQAFGALTLSFKRTVSIVFPVCLAFILLAEAGAQNLSGARGPKTFSVQ